MGWVFDFFPVASYVILRDSAGNQTGTHADVVSQFQLSLGGLEDLFYDGVDLFQLLQVEPRQCDLDYHFETVSVERLEHALTVIEQMREDVTTNRKNDRKDRLRTFVQAALTYAQANNLPEMAFSGG
jgi:hypothetical protein